MSTFAVLLDHRLAASSTDVTLFLAIPILWMLGVVLFIVYKLRSR
jgi:hypothetical protein